MAAAVVEEASSLFSMSWANLASATSNDEVLKSLIRFVTSGFPSERKHLPSELSPFWPVRDAHTDA